MQILELQTTENCRKLDGVSENNKDNVNVSKNKLDLQFVKSTTRSNTLRGKCKKKDLQDLQDSDYQDDMDGKLTLVVNSHPFKRGFFFISDV